MHSKYQRRRATPHAERGLWKRQTTTVDIPVDTSSGGFVLTAPTTITFVHTVTETATGSSSSTSSASVSHSQSSSGISTTSASVEQPTSTTTETSDSSQTPSQTATSFSAPTISPTAGTGGNSNGTVPQESGALSSTEVPGGAIAAIVIACLIVVIVALFYLLRSRSKRNRVRRRPLWTRSTVNASLGISSDSYEPKPSGYFDSQPSPPPVPPLPQWADPAPITVTVPPISYNSNDPALIAANPNLISTPRAVYALGVNGKSSVFSATVTSTFVTTLADELAIDVGETLRMVAEYDDGWSLCMNGKGEQGMVPMECLHRGRELRAAVSRTSLASTTTSSQDWRGSRRVSSLRP